jgi:hypothetical protein
MQLRLFFILMFVLAGFQTSAWAFSDTTFRKKMMLILPDNEAAAASTEENFLKTFETASPLSEKKHHILPQNRNLSARYLQKFAPKSIKPEKSLANKILKKNKFKNQHSQIKPPKAKQKSGFWRWVNKLIDLDWLMVGIAVAIGVLIIVGLYFLLSKNVLTLLQMILFALGFGGAVFFFWLANSESTAGEALYDYFVRYGFFSWTGILAIIAGFVGLFGGGGSFGGFLLVGLILGGISFLLSLLFKKSIFHRR